MPLNWHQCLSFCSPAGGGVGRLGGVLIIIITSVCSCHKNSFSVKVPSFSRHHNYFFFWNCKVRKVTRISSYHNTDLRCLLSGCKAVWRIKFEVLPTLALAGMSNGCTTLVTIETSDAFAQRAACPQAYQNETAAFINMADILSFIYARNLKLHLKFNSFFSSLSHFSCQKICVCAVKGNLATWTQLYKVEMIKGKKYHSHFEPKHSLTPFVSSYVFGPLNENSIYLTLPWPSPSTFYLSTCYLIAGRQFIMIQTC